MIFRTNSFFDKCIFIFVSFLSHCDNYALITQVNNEKPVSKSKSKYDGLLDADDGKNI
jgi:hypothetical protein